MVSEAMKTYKIYQIRDFSRPYSFRGIGCLRRDKLIAANGIPELPRDIWDKVYEYTTKKEPSLDWLRRCRIRRILDA